MGQKDESFPLNTEALSGKVLSRTNHLLTATDGKARRTRTFFQTFKYSTQQQLLKYP
jgi:hypothetical protein